MGKHENKPENRHMGMQPKLPNENAIIRKLSWVSIIGNMVLSAFKMFAGIYGTSGAMISDAVHSFSDVFTTVIAFFGVKISKRKSGSGTSLRT